MIQKNPIFKFPNHLIMQANISSNSFDNLLKNFRENFFSYLICDEHIQTLPYFAITPRR